MTEKQLETLYALMIAYDSSGEPTNLQNMSENFVLQFTPDQMKIVEILISETLYQRVDRIVAGIK